MAYTYTLEEIQNGTLKNTKPHGPYYKQGPTASRKTMFTQTNTAPHYNVRMKKDEFYQLVSFNLMIIVYSFIVVLLLLKIDKILDSNKVGILKTKMNRKRYLLSLIIIIVLFFATPISYLPLYNGIMFSIFCFLITVLGVFCSTLRLININYSKEKTKILFGCLLAVPYINFLIALYLLFPKSKLPLDNKDGDKQCHYIQNT